MVIISVGYSNNEVIIIDMLKALSDIEFRNREHMISHLPYDREMAFYQSIKIGDIKETKRLFKPLCSEDFGVLSENRLRNFKYHLIISVAFITRYCIEGGLEMETAYNLIDIYIMRIDKCQTENEINKIHRELVDSYAERMNTLLKKTLFSKSIMICIDYIYDNLHTKIKLENLSKACGLSTTYLSKLFHKEAGITVTQYITEKKIDAAKNLLGFSDYTCSDIANFLCFSSESHFINVFRRYTGYTPTIYKNHHFRTKPQLL